MYKRSILKAPARVAAGHFRELPSLVFPGLPALNALRRVLAG